MRLPQDAADSGGGVGGILLRDKPLKPGSPKAELRLGVKSVASNGTIGTSPMFLNRENRAVRMGQIPRYLAGTLSFAFFLVLPVFSLIK